MNSPPEFDRLCQEAKRALRKKDIAGAIQAFQKALALEGGNVDVHEGLATAYFLAKDYAKAVEHFTRITQLDPRKASAFINLGAVYNRMGDYKKATRVLRRGIQKDKRSAEAFYNLGIAHRGLDQLSMAVSAYREALRLAPNMAEAHQNLANVYLDLKNNQQAIRHYQKALELRPGFERAKRGLAKAEGAISEAKAAISPFGRLVDESVVAPRATPKVERALTTLERFDDRRDVHKCSIDIEKYATVLLRQLNDELEPSLLALNRAVVQGAEAPVVLARAHEDFQTAVKNCTKLRQGFKRKLLELRAHEELMNTPDLNAHPG